MRYLAAPWRAPYVKNVHKPAPCVFCAALKDGDDRAAGILLRGRRAFVILNKYPDTNILVEGHTDSKPFAANADYTNWELSADRANAARRLMQQNGVGPAQVTQVRGYADQRLRKPESPADPSNRRISVIVQYQVKPAGEPDPPPKKAPPAH